MRILHQRSLQGFDVAAECGGIDGVELVAAEDAAAMAAGAADADGLLVSAPSYTEAVARGACAAGSRVRWLQFMSAGYESAQRWGVPDGAIVTNASSVWGPMVAEHAVTLLLALRRQIQRLERDRAERRWGRAALMPHLGSVEGARVGILGYGAIGQGMAERLRPFGAKIIGIARSPGPRPGADEMVTAEALADIAPTLDALCSTIPLSPQTRQCVDAAILDRLPPHAVFVNVGRGGTVDQAALIERLADGRLAGAGLDVFDPEPLPADSPLWSLPNVILSPHVAAIGGGEGPRRLAALCRANIERFRDGKPLLDVVRDL